MKIIDIIAQILCTLGAVVFTFIGLNVGLSKGEPNYSEACFYLLIAVINYGIILIFRTDNNEIDNDNIKN